jgi:hypothetical protein
MTPVLVVDNSGRVVCRGHIKAEPGRATAHLQFARLEVPLPAPPDDAAAARTVAEIRAQVRERREAAGRRRRRQLFRSAILRGAKSAGIVLGGLVAGVWVVFFGIIRAIAAAFGFSL